jgi:hypothetical protein
MSEPKKQKKCCVECGTKIGLFGFSCRCREDTAFCSACRLPKFRPTDAGGHLCSVDYKQLGKLQIEKLNPKIECKKVDVI